LLGHPLIEKSVRDHLWHHRFTGFETALADLQTKYPKGKRLELMYSALADMYADMEQAFEGINFNFNNDLKSSIVDFLWKFDAIFTLNQDLLLERFYVSDVSSGLHHSAYRHSCHLPGIEKIQGPDSSFRGMGTFIPSKPPFQKAKHSQPYFKLHGSANWKTDRGGQLLILGGQKENSIASTPLLEWYLEELKQHLSGGNVRLMVIGYGFGDFHVNRILRNAVKSSALKFFIIDPLGSDIIDKNRFQRNVGLYAPDDELVDLWPGLDGASRRDLRAIFDRDRVEFQKLMRFFA
jgi:hypothetical protein